MAATESSRRPNGVRPAVRRKVDVEKSSSPLNGNSHLERGEMDASFKSRISNPDGEFQGSGAHTKTEDHGGFQLRTQKRLQSCRGLFSSETGLACFRLNRHEVGLHIEKTRQRRRSRLSRGTRPTPYSTCLRWRTSWQTGCCPQGGFYLNFLWSERW